MIGWDIKPLQGRRFQNGRKRYEAPPRLKAPNGRKGYEALPRLKVPISKFQTDLSAVIFRMPEVASYSFDHFTLSFQNPRKVQC